MLVVTRVETTCTSIKKGPWHERGSPYQLYKERGKNLHPAHSRILWNGMRQGAGQGAGQADVAQSGERRKRICMYVCLFVRRLAQEGHTNWEVGIGWLGEVVLYHLFVAYLFKYLLLNVYIIKYLMSYFLSLICSLAKEFYLPLLLI